MSYKVLYDNNFSFDNYIGKPLLVNQKITCITFEEACYHSCIVSQHFSTIVFYILAIYSLNFYSTPYFLLWNSIQSKILLIALLYSVICVYILRHYHSLFYKFSPSKKLERFLKNFRFFIIFTSFNFGLSPLLPSLTESVSFDSICTISVCSFFLNLLTQNYFPPSEDRLKSDIIAAKQSLGFAFNVALFGCFCLASRLPQSPYHAFITTSLAALVFGIWPDIRQNIKLYNQKLSLLIIQNNDKVFSKSPPLNNPSQKFVIKLMLHVSTQWCITTLFFILNIISLLTLDLLENTSSNNAKTFSFSPVKVPSKTIILLVSLYTVITVFINLIAPKIYVNMQKHKCIVEGPWDEAVPTLNKVHNVDKTL